MANITTVIFDMYETLAHNSPALWVETFQRICGSQELAVDHEELYRCWKSYEMNFRHERLNLEEPEKSPPFLSYEQAWASCFQRAFKDLDLQADASAAARTAVEHMGEREIYPDALQALPEIRTRWRTALLSNADDDYLNPTLERITGRFEVVLSSEQAQAYKPHPRPFLQVAEQLGAEPAQCAYVGDSQFDDVLGASRVGMTTIWVSRSGAAPDPNLPAPNYQVSDLTEIPGLLGR